MWDLTYTISEDMLLYPGIPQPVLHDFATPSRDGYGMSEFSFWNHLGTHIDAPTHFYADGKSLDRFSPDSFVKRVHTINCQHVQEISVSYIEAYLAHYIPGDGVLLLTGQFQYWGSPQYFQPYPVLNAEAAQYLISRQVSMVLVDAPSVDPVTTETFPNHHRLLKEPLLIVENLAYHPNLPSTFKVIALPLKVKNSNGSPARVIATSITD
ncbi:MAG: hypothetical protein C7B46_04990 [Sulfobacillus benefaciens]|uniref:Cyclase n=1 Tax=Sulfobacillus benefaciens TaxID=453960 RepID=A0A2T2XJ19_9FIRM|nr:MAG: hypothetical protein C7B46_04990 [Sulfobacillus benefaciens]